MFGLHSSSSTIISYSYLAFASAIAQLDREIGGVAPAQTVGGDAAGERPDERDLDLILGGGRAAGSERTQRNQTQRRADACGAYHGPILPGVDELGSV